MAKISDEGPDTAFYLRPREGTDGESFEIPLGNGKTPIGNLDTARYEAQRIKPRYNDQLVAIRLSNKIHTI